MSNLVHHIMPRLFAAATALARRRFGGDAAQDDILQFLTEAEFDRVIEEARACLEAAAAVDLAEINRRRLAPPTLDARHAALLGLDLNAHGVVILARDADHRVSGAYWARGVFEHATPYASAALAPVWLAATQALHPPSHPPAGVRAGSSSPQPPEQP